MIGTAFLVTTLIVVATPGPGALYVIAAGIRRGTAASLFAAVGTTLGILPHVLAAITGLAAILHSSAVAFQTLKYVGVAYLLYLAWATWRDKSELVAAEPVDVEPSRMRTVGMGAAVNLLNPKLTLFFFAFLPQFVPVGASDATRQMLTLSGVFMAVTIVVFAIYGVFAAAMRTYVVSRPVVVAWMRRTFAASYLALAARMALAPR